MGFTDLGNVNTHLSDLEHYLEKGNVASAQPMAKSMLVLMVRGLNSGLQFPYAQFPCATLRGDQMILEGCGSVTAVCFQGDGADMRWTSS